jgi:hypothetical protein
MKALTICQPYAELIARGEKRVENRTWPTSFRGLMYIHAGKSREWLDDPGEYETAADRPRNYGIPVSRMAFGCIVAIAKLVDCVHIERLDREHPKHVRDIYPWLADHEHTNGPWCWILDEVTPIGPWPWKGAQGLWQVDERELDRVANRTLGVGTAAT